MDAGTEDGFYLDVGLGDASACDGAVAVADGAYGCAGARTAGSVDHVAADDVGLDQSLGASRQRYCKPGRHYHQYCTLPATGACWRGASS